VKAGPGRGGGPPGGAGAGPGPAGGGPEKGLRRGKKGPGGGKKGRRRGAGKRASYIARGGRDVSKTTLLVNLLFRAKRAKLTLRRGKPRRPKPRRPRAAPERP